MMDILLFPLMYPLFMSIYWIVGTVYYVACYERKLKRKVDKDIGDMGISFLIPCYNEETTIKDTILNVYNLEFPNKEIIVINDGSSDDSARILEQLAHEIDFKFINLRENKGKANALNEGINHAKFDYVMVIDADTIIDNDGPYYMIQHFKNDMNDMIST